MRLELHRRLVILVRSLSALGARDAARALKRRVHDGTAAEWLRGEFGEYVWAEIGGAVEQAHRTRAYLPAELSAAAVAGLRAYSEAELLLAPEPSHVPFFVRKWKKPTRVLRVIGLHRAGEQHPGMTAIHESRTGWWS